MNQIINMVLRQVMRKLVNRGVNAGINAVAGKQDSKTGNAPQQDMKRAKQSMRMARRMAKSGGLAA